MNDNKAPLFIQQLDEEKKVEKLKQHFFYVVLQDDNGHIVDINHYTDYDTALLRGMEKAKDSGTFWSIYSLSGPSSKFVDGNFRSK